MNAPIPISKPVRGRLPWRQFDTQPRHFRRWRKHLTRAQLLCYLTVCDYTAGFRVEIAAIAQSVFTTDTGMKHSAVSRALADIERLGIIRIWRTRGSLSRYQIIDIPYFSEKK